jgi:metallophosphoesterase (TIGR00282 family)
MNILFIGDVVGKVGRRILAQYTGQILDRYKIDLAIANCENAAGGFGLTREVADELFGFGFHVLTSGNHIWDKKEVYQLFRENHRILRPANYPPGTPGSGCLVMQASNGQKVGILNLIGRVFMESVDCPFQAALEGVTRLQHETQTIIVDMHAEATSEKIAMGWYLDGKVTAVLGTHTHVQTADERLLEKGTAYISDVGMTGPSDSVIGVKKEIIIERFLTKLPIRFETAGGPGQLNGVVVQTTPENGRAVSIQRLQIHSD